MPSKAVVRAIDVGYGTTKFTTDDSLNCAIFPSLAPHADLHRDRARLYRDRRTSEVWVDGLAYEVGPDSTLFSDTPVLHGDYTTTPQYRALLYGALEAMRLERVDLLMTGLPVRMHRAGSERLKRLLVGTHCIRPGRIVEVIQAMVVMQPLGGFLAYSHERGGWSIAREQQYLLVDPGYFTFDWMVTRGMMEVPGLSNSVECGMSEYLRVIEDHLNHDLGTTYSNPRKIDESLRRGTFRLHGQRVNLQPYRERADTVPRRAVDVLRNHVGSGADIDEIVLVGGGAPFFAAALSEAFPRHTIRPVADPILANVRGFQLIGNVLSERANAVSQVPS